MWFPDSRVTTWSNLSFFCTIRSHGHVAGVRSFLGMLAWHLFLSSSSLLSFHYTEDHSFFTSLPGILKESDVPALPVGHVYMLPRRCLWLLEGEHSADRISESCVECFITGNWLGDGSVNPLLPLCDMLLDRPPLIFSSLSNHRNVPKQILFAVMVAPSQLCKW